MIVCDLCNKRISKNEVIEITDGVINRFAEYSVDIENIKDYEHICTTCFDYEMTQGRIKEKWDVECSLCRQKYKNFVGQTQGYGCDTTFDKQTIKGSYDYSGYGSKYDDDIITLQFDPKEIGLVLVTSNLNVYNLCDNCIDKLVIDNKVSLLNR